MDDRQWESIYDAIESAISKTKGTMLMTKVIKRNPTDKLIWVNELGDQPIPLLAFDYEVRYYDTDQAGVVTEKLAKVTPKVPDVGDLVFIAMEKGTKRLPRCVGKVQSKNFIVTSLDDA